MLVAIAFLLLKCDRHQQKIINQRRMQLKIPKIVSPSSSPPPKPPDEGQGQKDIDLMTEAIGQDWGQKTIDLLAESINHQINWAKERNQHYACNFCLSAGGGGFEDEYNIPLLAGRLPSKEVLDNLVERLFSGTAWKFKRSSIHSPVPWEDKTVYRIKWERR